LDGTWQTDSLFNFIPILGPRNKGEDFGGKPGTVLKYYFFSYI